MSAGPHQRSLLDRGVGGWQDASTHRLPPCMPSCPGAGWVGRRWIVGLTNEERRRLDELAGEIEAEDPKVARALSARVAKPSSPSGTSGSRRWFGSARWALLAVVLTGVAMPLLVLGVAVQEPGLFLFGTIALLGGPLNFTIRRGRGGS